MEGTHLMSKRLLRLLAVVLALALVGAACGSDDAGDVVDAAEDAVDDAADAVEEAVDDAEEAVEDAMDDEEEAMDDEEDAMDDEEVGGAVDEEAAEDALADAEDVEDAGAISADGIEALEALWAEERQAIIDDIVANGYGRDGDTVTGPGGMTIDLSACPADWDDVAGISDGTITVGHTIAQSGALAVYGNIAGGIGRRV